MPNTAMYWQYSNDRIIYNHHTTFKGGTRTTQNGGTIQKEIDYLSASDMPGKENTIYSLKTADSN